MIDQPANPDSVAARAGARAPVHRFAHRAMACTFELFIPGEDARYASQVAGAAFQEVDRVERELSRFIGCSDVAQINALAPGTAVRVGLETLECLRLAATIHAQTNGAFDVTVGGVGRAVPSTPGAREGPLFGMRHLELDAAGRTVTVLAEGLRVDLGGIGKGYALDRAVELLRQWGIHCALLHSGQSSVFALGRPDHDNAWSVQLRDPQGAQEPAGRARLCDCSLSGSAAYRRGNHIIDPHSGRPAQSTLGAWAIAASAAVADALSTAFMVMPPPEVELYCREHEDVSAALAMPVAGGYELVTFGPGLALPGALDQAERTHNHGSA